ncbi:MAG TPA: hypothetical protein VIR16_07235, partial [Candidatus Limnocylindrales bacterium]
MRRRNRSPGIVGNGAVAGFPWLDLEIAGAGMGTADVGRVANDDDTGGRRPGAARRDRWRGLLPDATRWRTWPAPRA